MSPSQAMALPYYFTRKELFEFLMQFPEQSEEHKYIFKFFSAHGEFNPFAPQPEDTEMNGTGIPEALYQEFYQGAAQINQNQQVMSYTAPDEYPDVEMTDITYQKKQVHFDDAKLACTSPAELKALRERSQFKPIKNYLLTHQPSRTPGHTKKSCAGVLARLALLKQNPASEFQEQPPYTDDIDIDMIN